MLGVAKKLLASYENCFEPDADNAAARESLCVFKPVDPDLAKRGESSSPDSIIRKNLQGQPQSQQPRAPTGALAALQPPPCPPSVTSAAAAARRLAGV